MLGRAVQCGEKAGGRFEQRLAEHAAVLQLKGWTQMQSRTAQAVQRQPSCPPGEVDAEDDDLGGAKLGWWVRQGRAGTKERTAEVIHREAHGCAKACRDLRADAGSVTRQGAECPARCGAVIGPLSRAACPTKKKVGLDPSVQPPLCCEGDLCEATFIPTKPDDAPGVGL